MTKNKFLGFFVGLIAANGVQVDFFENRSLLRAFERKMKKSGLDSYKIIVR